MLVCPGEDKGNLWLGGTLACSLDLVKMPHAVSDLFFPCPLFITQTLKKVTVIHLCTSIGVDVNSDVGLPAFGRN